MITFMVYASHRLLLFHRKQYIFNFVNYVNMLLHSGANKKSPSKHRLKIQFGIWGHISCWSKY